MELEEIEKSNFVERYEFQAGHVVGQLLKEEKEFGDLFVMASASTKEPTRELKPRGVFVLPRRSSTTEQAEVADEDEQYDYENVKQSAGNGSENDQSTRQDPPPRRSSTQSVNTVFTEETNKLDRFSGDIFKHPDALPIAKKPSPVTIRRRRNTWHRNYDYDTVQLQEIEKTQRPGSPILSTEREQEENTDPAFHVQSCQDMIPVPQQNHEKYIALYDYEPRMHGEIEIKAGQLVTVLEKCDNWFRGEASGRYGYFPGNYVQKAGNKDPVAPPIAKKPSPDTILRRRSMFEIRTDTVTTHYVHLRDIVQTQLPERGQDAHTDTVVHVQSCQDMISVPQQKPEIYIALYDYEPRSHDEIEIKEGNVVTVLEKCNKDWFRAEANGRRGYIPAYYVKKAEDRKSDGDLSTELETVLNRRRATLEKTISNEK